MRLDRDNHRAAALAASGWKDADPLNKYGLADSDDEEVQFVSATYLYACAFGVFFKDYTST